MEPESSLLCYKSPSLVPILCQMNPIQPYILKIHFNIILPSLPRFPEQSLPFKLSNQNSVSISNLSHVFYMPHLFLCLLSS
jgi:hypothetical protein